MINQQCQKALFFALFSLFSVSACISNSKNTSQIHNATSALVNEQSLKNLVTKGDEALSRRAYDEAQVQYSLAIKEQPKNTELLYKLAIVHYEKESFDVATELLLAVLDNNVNHVGAYEMLGLIALKNEHPDIAAENLSKAISLDNKRWRSHNAMGVVKDMQSLHSDAQWHFKEALINSPNKAKTENNLGYSFYLDGKYEQAEKRFRKATQLSQNYEKAWANLGLVYVRMKQYEDARFAFSKVTDDHVVSNNLGYLAMLQQDDQMARQELARAILLAPTYYPKASENLDSLNTKDASSDHNEVKELSQKVIPGDTDVGNKNDRLLYNAVQQVSVDTLTDKKTSVISNVDESKRRLDRAQIIVEKSNYILPRNEIQSMVPKTKKQTKSRSQDENLIREYLALLGHQTNDDNTELLDSAILSFQVIHQLEPSGKLNKVTKDKLVITAIHRVKTLLVSLSYNVTIDGAVEDNKTVNALRKFQKDNAIPASGTIDKATLSVLTRYLDGGAIVANNQ